MASNYAFSDFFKSPVDMNQLISTQRRNVEAFSAINQAVVEKAQEISRRQVELVRDNVENLLNASKDMFSSQNPEASLAKQNELAKDMFETSLANVREVIEAATQSGFEAFDVLNQCANETIEELGGTVSAKKTAAKKPSAK